MILLVSKYFWKSEHIATQRLWKYLFKRKKQRKQCLRFWHLWQEVTQVGGEQTHCTIYTLCETCFTVLICAKRLWKHCLSFLFFLTQFLLLEFVECPDNKSAENVSCISSTNSRTLNNLRKDVPRVEHLRLGVTLTVFITKTRRWYWRLEITTDKTSAISWVIYKRSKHI